MKKKRLTGNGGGAVPAGESRVDLDAVSRVHHAHLPVSYLRLIDSCITQFKARGPSRTCNESKEEEEGDAVSRVHHAHLPFSGEGLIFVY